MTDASHTLTRRGIASEDGRPWVTLQQRYGYADLDTHDLPPPLCSIELRHMARRCELIADALDEQILMASGHRQREAA